MRSLLVTVCAVLLAPTTFATDPATAVGKAKQAVTTGHHAEALALLQSALEPASAAVSPRERTAALSAIYFYSALAESGRGDQERAAAHLRSFLFYSPGVELDESKFPREFLATFKTVRKELQKRRNSVHSFHDAYPGFPIEVLSSVWPLDSWGASSEFVILATEEEKEAWGRLRDEAARKQFVDAFWNRRDPDAATPANEARNLYLSRIAFADIAFPETADGRGSLSDRGRVFVLFGPPKQFAMRAVGNRAGSSSQFQQMLNAGGGVEQWMYERAQLPARLKYNTLTVHFASERGSVVKRMVSDMVSDRAVKDAPAALQRE
jgi:GWxTD domain-containing protein